ncbi:MAG: NAD(P)-binding domain-containing protein [Acidobacteria bacterium]|nr:NAD(P)-binding domain-containing protein [Acidobacteriota bacterium]
MNALFDLEPTLAWVLSALVVALVVLPYVALFRRRRVADRARLKEARALGIDRPVAQFPFVDARHCIGCGACVSACPEGDVLGVVGGVAVVINGLRCVGHGRCADACPVGAIEIGLGDLKGRRDVPLLTDEAETTVPGVFVAGELSGLALIRNAIEQGVAVTETIAARLATGRQRGPDAEGVDLLVVGAGPAGLSAALAARERHLSVRLIDQEQGLGGTILQFPRRKLVLTRPVELPTGTALDREEYTKEQVLAVLDREISRHRLDIRRGERFESLERRDDDTLEVRTSAGAHRARHVLLALGRRGTPRKLGVPGEELGKVAYQLRDATSWRGLRILVVGGGDSAVEAAIGLARQAGNEVSISYRKSAFLRIKKKNQDAVEKLIRRGRIRAIFDSQVEAVEADRVLLRVGEGREALANDQVFVLIGGDPPFELLRRSGVRFGGDPAAQPRSEAPRRAPAIAGLALALAALGAPAFGAQASPHGHLEIPCADCHTTRDWQEIASDRKFRHESTGFPLAGAHATAACSECHRDPIFSRVATACQDCHLDAHLGELGLDCARCHDTRRWDARDDVFRAHDRTIFPLLAGHARVDCEGCHGGQPPNEYSRTPTDCMTCHHEDYRAATDPPHRGFSTDCLQCHVGVTQGWSAPGFRHTARFPLTGPHAGIDCADCHRDGYVGTSADCYDCHRDDYERTRDPDHVAAGFPTTCQSCHGATSWEGAVFDHALSGFPLTGAHRTLDCEQCHQSGFGGTPSDCIACHRSDYERTRDPNHAQAGFSTRCQECHSTSSWEGSGFSHDATGFPLTGAHRAAVCEACHSQGYAGTSTACYSCHRADYEGTRDPNHAQSGFPTTCQNCHGTTSWNTSSFDHDASRFPLTGAHRGLDCESCHSSGFAGTPTDCVSCHRADYDATDDPNHAAAGFPLTCQVCHSTTRWDEASFNHDSTIFPLTGAHRSVACESCHAAGYSGTPTTCVSCHQGDYNSTQDPNHAASGFSTTCEACHTTASWQGATFDHNATGFSLTGAHASIACESCHASGYSGTPSACVSCHQADYNSTQEPNHAAAGFPTTCETCHTTSSWQGATFDHNATAFPLTGAHTSTACESCHASGYSGTPTACVACHQNDYNQANDPNHVSAGFPTTCESCHTTSSWDGATFDHDGSYFPIYSGKHRNKWASCSTCHVVPSNYAVFECTVCHEHRRSEMDSEHDDVGGYVYQSQACYNCHPTGEADD